MKLLLGIDPGKNGALAALAVDGTTVEVFDAPLMVEVTKAGKENTVLDPVEMVAILKRLQRDHQLLECAIERPLYGFGEGTGRSGTTGQGWGLWVGILTALEIPYALAYPATWRTIFKGTEFQAPTRASFTPDCVTGDDRKRSDARRKRLIKKNSRQFASELWPCSSCLFKLEKHDGRAEAALLAYWLRKTHWSDRT